MRLLSIAMLACFFSCGDDETIPPECGDYEGDAGVLHGSVYIENPVDMELVLCYREITGEIRSENNQGMLILNFPNLETVGGRIHITGADDLHTVGSMATLTTVGGYLRFEDCGELNDLNGFDGLHSVDALRLVGNSKLTDISALGGLVHVETDITISDNPLLPSCRAQALVDQLVDFDGTVTISGNDDTATCD